MCRGEPAPGGELPGAGLGAVQPGVLRGEVDRLEEGAVHVDVELGVDPAAARGVRDGVAGHQGVGAGPGGELDVVAGVVQRDGLAAGRLARDVADGPVGPDDLRTAAGDTVLRLVGVVRHVGAAPDEEGAAGGVVLALDREFLGVVRDDRPHGVRAVDRRPGAEVHRGGAGGTRGDRAVVAPGEGLHRGALGVEQGHGDGVAARGGGDRAWFLMATEKVTLSPGPAPRARW